jgi:hypothetical protein
MTDGDECYIRCQGTKQTTDQDAPREENTTKRVERSFGGLMIVGARSEFWSRVHAVSHFCEGEWAHIEAIRHIEA